MKKNIFLISCFLITIALLPVACEKDPAPAQPEPDPEVISDSWNEDFENVGQLSNKGWIILNNSSNVGTEAWRQGRFESTNKYTNGFDYTIGFPAYNMNRSVHEFVSVDMYAGTGVSNLNVWLISPIVKMKNGDELSFYTRRHIDDGSFSGKPGFGNDRLEVRINDRNSSAFAGANWNEVGDFTDSLLSVNPALTPDDYPEKWTKFTVTLSTISGTVNGRIAFRYFVPSGGPDGPNASLVGIDAISFKSK